MEAVELSLAGWLDLYNQLSAAERLLAKADSAGSAGLTGELRARVERLRHEVDVALGERHGADEGTARASAVGRPVSVICC